MYFHVNFHEVAVNDGSIFAGNEQVCYKVNWLHWKDQHIQVIVKSLKYLQYLRGIAEIASFCPVNSEY